MKNLEYRLQFKRFALIAAITPWQLMLGFNWLDTREKEASDFDFMMFNVFLLCFRFAVMFEPGRPAYLAQAAEIEKQSAELNREITAMESKGRTL